MIRFTCLTLSLLALGPPARAEATLCTAIASLPHTITAPGIYCLKSSLAAAGTGITIDASDVTVDLNGYALEVTVTGVTSHGRSNITVRNGTIRGGSYGVALTGIGTSGNLVERMRVEGSTESGITIHGHGGVVRNNVVIGVGNTPNGDKAGIQASFGTGLRVSDNQVVDTGLTTPDQIEPVDASAARARVNAIRVPMPIPGQIVDAISVVDAPGAVIERNLVSNTAMMSSELSAVGIRIYPTAGSTIPMTTTVVGNRIVNMTTGIDNSGASSLYLKNAVSGAATPFTGGTLAGGTNHSF